ncbi:unnamed protein product [Triticum turgidum subsp. durum]|uniref:Uncharacterized protein n=2 Tax=Triticum TaxID=4564 RepID=A0A9R1S5F1_TRITD|nr:unnamed protein product [Triticum aestivum]VAH81198.1 unnamed protein product [Triticum turgidum subsp. durum]
MLDHVFGHARPGSNPPPPRAPGQRAALSIHSEWLPLLSSARRLAVEKKSRQRTWPPPLYIAVANHHGGSFRYTRPVLQSALQLMGCKPRHAFRVRLPPSSHLCSPAF